MTTILLSGRVEGIDDDRDNDEDNRDNDDDDDNRGSERIGIGIPGTIGAIVIVKLFKYNRLAGPI